MTDRDGWSLRGPVQSCRVERTWYSRRCGAEQCDIEECGDITVVEFRPDGALVRRWHKNPDGSEWRHINEYNSAGQLSTERSESVTEPASVKRHEYDVAGRLIRTVILKPDGQERVDESYEYDATGQKTKTHYIDLAAQSPNMMYAFGVEGTDCSFSAPGAATLITRYNLRGQPAELLFHDRSGRALSRVEFLYDAAGNLVEETQTVTKDTLPPELLAQMNPAQLEGMLAVLGNPMRRRHRYDPQGRRTDTQSSTFGKMGQDTKTMAYNEHGDLVEETRVGQHSEYTFDHEGKWSEVAGKDGATASEARFLYEYDGRGNWTSKTVEARSRSNQDFSVSSIEKRTITYFE
jgi:hypothetical protein